ncbi:MAG: hypothetical protein Q7S92_04850 [Candidatus Diapherotrites archaeon]|nr:hypothetical protein [Candidatus Diapherotrites archaeon]
MRKFGNRATWIVSKKGTIPAGFQANLQARLKRIQQAAAEACELRAQGLTEHEISTRISKGLRPETLRKIFRTHLTADQKRQYFLNRFIRTHKLAVSAESLEKLIQENITKEDGWSIIAHAIFPEKYKKNRVDARAPLKRLARNLELERAYSEIRTQAKKNRDERDRTLLQHIREQEGTIYGQRIQKFHPQLWARLKLRYPNYKTALTSLGFDYSEVLKTGEYARLLSRAKKYWAKKRRPVPLTEKTFKQVNALIPKKLGSTGTLILRCVLKKRTAIQTAGIIGKTVPETEELMNRMRNILPELVRSAFRI